MLKVVNIVLLPDMDLIGFNFDDMSQVFTTHLTVLPLVLVGSAKPPVRLVERLTEGERTPSPKAHRPLSPSYTPIVPGGATTRPGGVTARHAPLRPEDATTRLSGVQSSLNLAKTHTGQSSGEWMGGCHGGSY